MKVKNIPDDKYGAYKRRILLTGIPGTGKTTYGEALATRFDFVLRFGEGRNSEPVLS